MELSSSALLCLLSFKGAGTAQMLLLGPEGVCSGSTAEVLAPFSQMTAPPAITSGLWASSVSIPLADHPPVVLHGAQKGLAHGFITEIERRWRSYNQGRLAQAEGEIAELLRQLKRLDAPHSYPSACAIGPILSAAARLEHKLLSRLPQDAIGREQNERLAPIRSFATNPTELREKAIERFVRAELERWKEFFDTVESKPLTPEQRLSIVVDEDATLVLAGAGSGKTSVITAKAAYLLRAGVRPAEEILLLAFAKDAAKEMSERIEARCGMPIEARTFHALAYDIIGAVEGAKPPLAAHATDDTAFLDLIRQILRDLMTKVAEVAGALISWFTEFLVEQKDDWDYKTKHEYYKQLEKLDLRTLQGEQVKSREELSIANWLYQNGVAYEYEPDYEHKVATGGRRRYLTTPSQDLALVCSLAGVDMDALIDRMRKRLVDADPLPLLPHQPLGRMQPPRTRDSRLKHAGASLTVRQWSERTGISTSAIRARLRTGWTIAEALTVTPSESHQRRGRQH